MENRFQTMASNLTSLTDCRVLCLEIDYSNVDLAIVKAAARLFCERTKQIYQDAFVTTWHCGDRSTTEKGLLSALEITECGFDFDVTANVRTEAISTEKQLRSFLAKLRRDTSLQWSYHSNDYGEYFAQNIRPVLQDDVALKEALVHLFQEEGRKNLGYYNYADSYGLFLSSPEGYKSKEQAGSIQFYIAVGCLGNEFDAIADRFAGIMTELCDLLGFANGRVGIFPSPMYFHHAYSSYFHWEDAGKRKEISAVDAPAGCNPRHWRKVLYCCGYDWANVISVPAQSRIPSQFRLSSTSEILSTKQLPSGSLFVKLQTEISRTDVSQLSAVKDFMYKYLSPGCSFWPRNPSSLQWAPRHNWEMLAVEENEIELLDKWIVFRKK